MADNKILSSEMVVKWSGETIAHATDFTFTVDKSVIDVTTLSSDGWKESLVGNKSWSIDFSGLVTRNAPDSGETDYNQLINDLVDTDTAVATYVSSTNSGDYYKYGTGFISNLSFQGSLDGAVTYGGHIEGSGPLSGATVS